MMGASNKAFSAAGNSGRVLAAAPLKYSDGGFTAKQFDRDIYDAKAVALKMDNSVVSLTINNNNEAVLGGAKKLFDTGEDTVWGSGTTPTLVNPLPK